MEWLGLALALFLPVFTGAACVGPLIAPDTPARPAIVWGNGALLGLFLTTLVMRLQDAVGLPLRFSITATGHSVLHVSISNIIQGPLNIAQDGSPGSVSCCCQSDWPRLPPRVGL